MGEGFDEDFKERVRSATDIVDLVSETVALKPTRGGADHIGLCPFHEDRNPSFHVYPQRQSYRCWVCNVGGDCFTWVTEMEKVPFPEAVEILARRANLEIPRRSGRRANPELEKRRIDSYEIVEWAAKLMHKALLESPDAAHARQYVDSRQLFAETITQFCLGYHPENWTWFQERALGRYSPAQLHEAGLTGRRDSGDYFDNLVGRLVFPIVDERGRFVAFGGRELPESNIEFRGKYWNSLESTIFHKRRTLYAFHEARQAIRADKSAVIVEGYMDCIACHQAGIRNVIATLGTAMTEDHVRFLKRFTQQAILLYDGDAAGQMAAERSIPHFLGQGLDLRILTLRDVKDPADYLNEHTSDQFRELIGTAVESWQYKLDSAAARHGLDTVAGREATLNDLLELLKAAPGLAGSVREDMILREAAQRVHADERTARRQLAELRGIRAPSAAPPEQRKRPWGNRKGRRFQERAERPQPPPVPSSGSGINLMERELLEVLIAAPNTIDIIRHEVGPHDFDHPLHQRLLEMCIHLRTEEGELPEFHRLIAAADSDGELVSLLNMLLDGAEDKGVVDLLAADLSDAEGELSDSVPVHLERVLAPLLERREKRQNQVSKQRMAQAGTAASELDSDTRDALRRLTEFRQSQMGHPSSPK